MLRETLSTANPFIRSLLGRYFAADPKAPLEAWLEEAARHPVFLLTPVQSPVPDTEYRVLGGVTGCHSTVTVLARLRGLSTSMPLAVAT